MKLLIMLANFVLFSIGFDASEDYFLGCNVRLDFERGDRRRCYTNYTIRDDSICEPTEFFMVEVIVTTNDRFINVNSSLSETTVSIDDTAEPECSKYTNNYA